eukprot:3699099-Amphidinium_carterae.1
MAAPIASPSFEQRPPCDAKTLSTTPNTNLLLLDLLFLSQSLPQSIGTTPNQRGSLETTSVEDGNKRDHETKREDKTNETRGTLPQPP